MMVQTQVLTYCGKSLRIPTKFTPAGEVSQTRWLDDTPAFVRKAQARKVSGAKLAGMKYEKLVHNELAERYDGQYMPGPWIQFQSGTSSVWRPVQPDGLIIDVNLGRITIVEIKLRHTKRAWWQLRQLYQPVVRHAFKSADWEIGICEVFKWFHVGERMPEKFQQVVNPGQRTTKEDGFAICRMDLK